jgi:3-deoxy-D-manno-octulosonic-acid transferase
MGGLRLPPLLLLYRLLISLFTPPLLLWLLVRAARGKEDPRRLPERLGLASAPRPAGALVWLHAASVGELSSLVPLLRRVQHAADAAGRSRPTLLVTSVTRSAAALAPQLLPAGVIHQLVPIDHWLAFALFRRHWRPDLALLAEAELWPELIRAMGAPVLINARVSARSHRRHRRMPWFGRWLYGQASACFPQSGPDGERLRQLGAPAARAIGSTKWDAGPLPQDPRWVERLRRTWPGRPVLLLASSHGGEEAALLAAWPALARHLAGRRPALLLAPRHPERLPEVLAAARAAGLMALPLAALAGGAVVPGDAAAEPVPEVVVVDRLGLMGSWIAVADVVVIGGSFGLAGRAIGGHNPLEPVQGGRPVVCGPDMANFAGLCDQLEQAGWLWPCADAPGAWRQAMQLLACPPDPGPPPPLAGPSTAIAALVLERLP